MTEPPAPYPRPGADLLGFSNGPDAAGSGDRETDRVIAWLRGLGPRLWAVAFVLLVGLVQVGQRPYEWPGALVIVVGVVAALLVARRAPGPALTVCWGIGAFQVLTMTAFQVVELTLVVVAYATGRWGSRTVVWLGGVSVVAGPVLASLLGFFFGRAIPLVDNGFGPISGSGLASGMAVALGPVAVGGILLGLPWLAGLAVRSTARADASDRSRLVAEEQTALAAAMTGEAQEIARLREEQARLARDVHDVVGHSLAVILAQAESGQYLPDSEPARLKATLATIATSARSSLQDVRQVLGDTRAAQRAGGLDAIVDGVVASGHPVRSSVVGTPLPLPPELEAVAYRVLQEMLTNALKHGDREAPIVVERHWPSGDFGRDLRLEVMSVDAVPEPGEETVPVSGHGAAATQRLPSSSSRATELLPAGSGTAAEAGTREGTAQPPETEATGHGLDGMRRRLESVGGRLDVRRREEAGRPTFTVTAWVPVRSG